MCRNFFKHLSTDSDGSPGTDSTSSDFVLILAAFLCALICVLGLIAIVCCAWIRRLSTDQSPISDKDNRALKKKVLSSLPKLTFSPESLPKFSDCAICLAEYAAGDEIRVLSMCSHAFHVVCVDTWLGSHNSCPSCCQILQASSDWDKCDNLRGSSAVGGLVEEAEASMEARLNHWEDANRFLP